MIKPTVLVVDDELAIRRLLDITLTENGYQTLFAENGRAALLLAAENKPDAVLLDIGLPDTSGHEILLRMRQWYLGPIIILSALNNECDIVGALDNGANDYLVKPFRNAELLARLRASIRALAAHESAPIYRQNNLEVDIAGRTVFKNGAVVKLTEKEFDLLSLFVRNGGKVLTHSFLLKEVWGLNHQQDTQYLRVFIAALRKKLEDNPNEPRLIITESGVGYRFSSL